MVTKAKSVAKTDDRKSEELHGPKAPTTKAKASEVDAYLSTCSSEELQEIIDKAETLKAERVDEEKEQARQKYRELEGETGFSIEELFGKRKGAKQKVAMPAKYKDPEDPTNTWTGRGVRPNWLKKRLAAGEKLEDFQNW